MKIYTRRGDRGETDLFAGGRVLGFRDWFTMTGYDSASRNELTSWSLHHVDHAQINIGVRSTLVNMGVTVASLALGTKVLRRFDDEEELEFAFQQALRSLGARGAGSLGARGAALAGRVRRWLASRVMASRT